jgi:hypothetical protein
VFLTFGGAAAGACRSLSRPARGGAANLQPFGYAIGPAAAAIGGGMWTQSDTGGYKIPATHSRHVARSCSAVRGRGRTPGAVLR